MEGFSSAPELDKLSHPKVGYSYTRIYFSLRLALSSSELAVSFQIAGLVRIAGELVNPDAQSSAQKTDFRFGRFGACTSILTLGDTPQSHLLSIIFGNHD